MEISKAWDWSKEDENAWRLPCSESYYFAERWKRAGYNELLDFGCGLGRHSVFFAKKGFTVKTFDLSLDGVSSTLAWAKEEGVVLDVRHCDMLSLNYPDNSFDCIFEYHVLSHTDKKGMERVIAAICRMLRSGGEVFLTFCSKETYSFSDDRNIRIDENTVVFTAEGAEKGIPHYFADLDDIKGLLKGFELIEVRHSDICVLNGKDQLVKHYYVLARKKDSFDNGSVKA